MWRFYTTTGSRKHQILLSVRGWDFCFIQYDECFLFRVIQQTDYHGENMHCIVTCDTCIACHEHGVCLSITLLDCDRTYTVQQKVEVGKLQGRWAKLINCMHSILWSRILLKKTGVSGVWEDVEFCTWCRAISAELLEPSATWTGNVALGMI